MKFASVEEVQLAHSLVRGGHARGHDGAAAPRNAASRAIGESSKAGHGATPPLAACCSTSMLPVGMPYYNSPLCLRATWRG